ncbi:carboxypeptidase regulatory-like domain-containing protein [Apibacter raozihei]|uniref:carboxypeptidase regulatory-like domain-containing protein n=1 Tax=Apibacter TaxID=1778601 RepID=UPI000FE2DF44|nr:MULTISPECIES: carboxypeptidase regulatory-like domain-containing protein [Apibacter]
MMKFRLSCLIVFFYQVIIAQTMIFGYLKDQDGKPVNHATISLGEDRSLQVSTDFVGYFQIKDLTPGKYLLIVTKSGYIPSTLSFTLSQGEIKKDMGEIKLEYNPSQVDVGMITLTDGDLSTDEGSTVGQTGIGLLQASRDVFSRTAAFELGAYWFKVRGTDNRYSNILFNGIPMSKNHTGRPDFGNWGGLNNVIKYPYELAENNTVSDFSFSDLGGTTYYDTRASNYRKGLNLSYSLTNRTYQHRLMATYSTGMLPSGWAFTISGSRRWMEEGVIDGTYNDSYAYFASIEKKLSDKHRINLTAFGSPSRKSGSSPNTQEAYDLRGKNYNSYWGWQDGDKRNERVKRIFEPMFMLSHYWDISPKTLLTTTASYQFGYNKSSRLNRFEADNPSPTYYKNLPSYWLSVGNATEYQRMLDAWESNDTSVTQVNWERLYNANYNAPTYTDPYSGITGRRATFFLVDDVIKDKTFNAATHLSTQFADNWKFILNLNYQNLNSENYREVNDLLGADLVINKSSFLKGDGSATSIDDYNIERPGSVARKGDKTEYYYKLHRQEVSANATTRLTLDKWEMAVSLLFAWNEAYRDGKFRHGLYADNSYGKSNKANFIESGMRAGLTYKMNGRNFITLNAAYYESAPTLNEIFANPRLNNQMSPNLTNQKINASDISYVLRTPTVKARATGYYTKIKDAVEITRYYAQGVSLDGNGDAFISEVLTGVEKDYLGTEIGIDWKIMTSLTLSGIASVGQYTYKNNPDLYILSDVATGVNSFGKSYIKDYKIAGTPQKGYSLGLRYNNPRYWWVGVTGNFLQDIYSDISALSRTKNFVMEDPAYPYEGATPETVRAVLKQKQYQDVFMLNANAGKSFRFGKYSMGVSLSVNNIFNERGYVTGAFEQGRYSNYAQLAEDQARTYPLFGNKLFYDRGRSYFLNVYLRF